MTEVKVYLREFAKDEYIDFVEDELDAKNKDFQNELESLQDKNLEIHKSIESNKTDISET